MGTVTNFLLCSFVVVIVQGNMHFKPVKPLLKVKLGERAQLECCYTTSQKSVELTWLLCSQDWWYPPTMPQSSSQPDECFKVSSSEHVIIGNQQHSGEHCGTLTIKSVLLNDTALYQCHLNSSRGQRSSTGTYLRVYKPLEKTIDLSENTKNNILTAEGILLFLCVILPAATLMCKSNKLNELERKKVKKEEENIYQGLNLEDCCSTYDQIERSQVNGPYQDVCNIIEEEEEEEIQLEKP